MTNAENETKPGKSPSHIAYAVKEVKGNSFRTRIGAAWPMKNGKGFNIQLEALPLDGRITLFVPFEEKEEPSA